MAKMSAWLAVVAAAAIAIALALDAGRFEFGAIGPVIAAILLALGAFRTVRAMSGGLRLLCGAWGVATGLALAHAAQFRPLDAAPDIISYFVVLALTFAGPTVLSATGLALVVLHREKKG